MKKSIAGNPSKKEKQIIEHVLGKNKDQTIRRKEILITEGVLLALPLIITLAVYANIIIKTSSDISGESMSPIGAEPLVIFMLGFIVIYCIFLGVMYKKLKKQIDELKNVNKKETR